MSIRELGSDLDETILIMQMEATPLGGVEQKRIRTFESDTLETAFIEMTDYLAEHPGGGIEVAFELVRISLKHRLTDSEKDQLAPFLDKFLDTL